MQLGPKAALLCKTTCNDSHSWSPILILVKSLYVSFCWWIIRNYILFCTISELSLHIGHMMTFDIMLLLINSLIPVESELQNLASKTRVVIL